MHLNGTEKSPPYQPKDLPHLPHHSPLATLVPLMNSASFNQDASCISVGTANGYKVLNCNPFSKFYAGGEGAIGQAQMLFNTSLIVVVGKGEDPLQSPRRLRIINTKRQITICELTFPTAVLKVVMNRQRLVVVLENQIFIYNIASMRLLHTLETAQNPQGIADLSTQTDSSILVYPSGPSRHSVGSATYAGGEFTVLDCTTLVPINVIKAHRAALAYLELSADGTLLASASTKGTIVRVFSIPAGTLLHQFRRGSYNSTIYSLAFNLNSTILAVSSSTGTVHIYRLIAGSATNSGALMAPVLSNDSEMQALIEQKRKGYLPSLKKQFSKTKNMIWEQNSRDYASFKVPGHIGPHILGLPPLNNLIYVACLNGSFYQYQINMEQGGECTQVSQHSLV